MSAHMLRCPEGSTNTTWKALWNSARDGCKEKEKKEGKPSQTIMVNSVNSGSKQKHK